MSEKSAAQMLKLILWNKITALVFRVFVGGVFVYASIDKIIHPGQFADMVYNYRMLPYFIINFFAVILPWIELVIGLCLILGPFSDAASAVTGALLIMFIISSAAALVRGLDISCGCFTTSGEGARAGWEVIITNIFLISMLAQSFFFALLRQRPRQEA